MEPYRIAPRSDNTGQFVAIDRLAPYLLIKLPCRADGVFMGPPFLAFYGAVTHNKTLLLSAYTNCKLYRQALRLKGPTGYLWGHIYDDDNKVWIDKGIWGTGKINASFLFG